MKKRVNITRDVESRRNIAALKPAVQPIVKPTKAEKSDAKSEKIQGDANNQASPEHESTTTKRARATKGNAEKV